MMERGASAPPGASLREGGVQFSLWAPRAEAVELCLFDSRRQPTGVHFLPECNDGLWRGFLPGAFAGQRYAYRIHGRWEPEQGMRFNPAKLLLDPYATAFEGRFNWSSSLFDFDPESSAGEWVINHEDSAPDVPLCIVDSESALFQGTRPQVPWTERIIYEANVRGYTMRFPGISKLERGLFRGMRNGEILSHLKALGITSLELMPVQAGFDEPHLQRLRLRNYWGYNPIQYFTPDLRFCGTDDSREASKEFREMVHAIHDAGIEVILDVVYNHTAEGDERGPSLSFRGIDNLAYYRSEPDQPGQYVNDTGCGNTLNADEPCVQDLVLDSLSHWKNALGVDGFRFDLATILGRHSNGFSREHPLLQRIGSDPRLEGALLIAEPWDPGPGGYQLGQFPPDWMEWNDRFRDRARQFWRGDAGLAGPLAKRLHGSADLFESSGRSPQASVNFVTSHDGFTLQDLVSYEHRHNEANGEDNRDGHRHNYSSNHGVEGHSDDAQVSAARRKHRLNLLATLLFSQGTPLLLAGDEFGNSQAGNNNAYAQDNETGWLDWSGLEQDPDFFSDVCRLIRERRSLVAFGLVEYVHEQSNTRLGPAASRWFGWDGTELESDEWNDCRAFFLETSIAGERLAICVNARPDPCEMRLPAAENWYLLFASSPESGTTASGFDCAGLSLGILRAVSSEQPA